ncbi:hypothetical protein G7046_g369 [Stylonectria norvegica]|nr:hypothetical protein G7046_g369 [Stylonectria norvegica]
MISGTPLGASSGYVSPLLCSALLSSSCQNLRLTKDSSASYSAAAAAERPFVSRSASGDGFAEPRTAGPTPPNSLQRALAGHRTAVVSGTVASHFAHWQYLTRYRQPAKRHFAAAGLGWGLVYLGVLSSITVAQRAVNRHAATSKAC